MFEPIVKGALISGGLIVAIGAQNAFVLRQGLRKQHVFSVSLVCFVCDVVLMAFGVMGVGVMINSSPSLTNALALGGAAFLFFYGFNAFRNAYRGNGEMHTAAVTNPPPGALKKIVGYTLILTLLNPHVYLDTVVVIGAVAGTLDNSDKLPFLSGASVVSGVWFFGLGYGARLLAPWFRSSRAWRILDTLVGCVMWWIASGLIVFVLGKATT